MTNINLPANVQQEVREFYATVQLTQSQQRELDEFLDQISPSLKLKVQGQIFTNVLST
jgi:hypothetical protein